MTILSFTPIPAWGQIQAEGIHWHLKHNQKMHITEDHRTRVAALRREKMRSRLLESALQIISSHGVPGLSIDRLIAHAEVSRGTFYKYYDAPQAVVRELALGISDELIQHSEPLVLQIPDPAARIATGLRALMYACIAHPVLGHFLIQLGWTDLNDEHHIFSYVKRDVDEGQRQNRFILMAPELALCMVGVAALAGIQVMLTSKDPSGMPEQTAAAVLRALGMQNEEAQKIALLNFSLPNLPETGLIYRATKIARQQNAEARLASVVQDAPV